MRLALGRPPTVRRGAVALALASALVASGAGTPGPGLADPAAAAPASSSFARSFADPAQQYQPKTRVWWACGNITTAEVRSQLTSIKDAGFSGVEIICFASAPQYGWGSAAMNARIQDSLDLGEELGLTVDWTVSGSWPLNVPGLAAADAGSAKEMVQGTAVLTASDTFNGPPPAAAGSTGTPELLAVQAVRCQDDCTGDAPVALVPGSVVDLTASVSGGSLTWTAPAQGTWLLIASWQRPTGQISVVRGNNNVEPGVVADHFSKAGAQAGIEYWNEHVLTPSMRSAFERTGGDLFEDSLELDSRFHWTPGFLDEFQERRGYDLRPYLPVLVIPDIHQQYSPVKTTDAARYALDPSEDARVRRDYYDTLTELYRENHIEPIKAFAHSIGLTYRAQAYGTTTDYGALSLDLDVPESEGLASGMDAPTTGPLDEYRTHSAAVSLTDKDVLSSECCAIADSAWAEPWEDQVARFNAAYAGGVNQVVLHGVSQQAANGRTWPGWSPFTSQGGNGFSDAHGPSMPSWDDVPAITEWMGRMQYAMRSGQQKVDVAVFRDVIGHGTPDVGDLSDSGYTYEYLSSAHLDLDAATVRGKVLAPATAGYRALVLADQAAMPLDSARRVLSHAKAGLPIVVVGALPSTTPGRDGQDAALRAVVGELTTQPSVRRVPDAAELPGALAALGARPAAAPSAPSALLTQRRTVKEGDVYLVHNPSEHAVTRTLTLEGAGRPALLDAWSGSVEPVGAYRTPDARHLQLKIELQPGESKIYGLGSFTSGPSAHVDEPLTGVTATTDGRLFLGADEPGTYDLRLSNGRRASVQVGAVPAPRLVRGWDLTVEDWHAGAAGALEKTTSRHELTDLKPWSKIPGLEDTSGVGTYRTTIDVPQAWTGGRRAVLDLGTVTDTVQVRVNGKRLTVDQTLAQVDVSDALRRGENTIEVRVATQLRNRLRVTSGYPAQASQPRQDYGLLGPVVLRPYARTQIWPLATPPAKPVPVVKQATSTSLKVSPSKVRQGKRATATIVVRGVRSPTGKVRVSVDGRTFRTVTLRNGRATVSLSSRMREGRHVVRVLYLGDARSKTSTSVKRSITVLRKKR